MSISPEPRASDDEPVAPPRAASTSSPRTRRAMLAGLAGGAGALIAGAIGRVTPARAAAGDPLLVGRTTNNSGTADTQLIANSSITAFTLYQQGSGTALMGYVTRTSGNGRGVYGRTDSPNGDGIQARNAGAAGSGAAVRAFGGHNTGVVATATDHSAIVATASSSGGLFGGGNAVDATGAGLFAASVLGHEGAGFGVFGESTLYGVYGTLASGSGSSSFAVYSNGNAKVVGDLTVTGAKIGYVADYAVNGSSETLQQGDAVTILGARAPLVGDIPLLVVGPAKAGDAVVGIVDRAMKPETLKSGNPVTKEPQEETSFAAAGTSVAPEQHLLVVTVGAYAVASAEVTDAAISPGDRLMLGKKSGKLVSHKSKDAQAAGGSVGFALGKMSSGSGKVAVFVSPR